MLFWVCTILDFDGDGILRWLIGGGELGFLRRVVSLEAFSSLQ